MLSLSVQDLTFFFQKILSFRSFIMRRFVSVLLVFFIAVGVITLYGLTLRADSTAGLGVNFMQLEHESKRSSEYHERVDEYLSLDLLHQMRVSYVILGDEGIPLASLHGKCPSFDYQRGILKVVYPLSQVWPCMIVSSFGISFSIDAVGIDHPGSFESLITPLRKQFEETGDLRILGEALVTAAKFGAEHVSLAYSMREDGASSIFTGVTAPHVDKVVNAFGDETSTRFSEIENAEERLVFFTNALKRAEDVRTRLRLIGM